MKRNTEDIHGRAFARMASRYLDGAMTREERRGFEDLLHRSAEARQRVEAEKRRDQLATRALRAALAPRGFAAPLSAPRDVASEFRRTKSAWPQVAALLLVAAMLAAGGWWISRPEVTSEAPRAMTSIPEAPRPKKQEVEERPSTIEEFVRPGSIDDRELARSRRAGGWPLPSRDALLPDRPSQALHRHEPVNRGRRSIQSRLLGWFNEAEDRLYLFEVDRIQTRVVPAALDL